MAQQSFAFFCFHWSSCKWLNNQNFSHKYFNMCDLWSLPLWSLTYSAILLPLSRTYFLSYNSLGHFAWYTKLCWWSNLFSYLIWKQVLSFLPVYTIWVLTVSCSSLCIEFFIDFMILSVLFPLYSKSRKCFLLLGTSSYDDLSGNCC